MTAEEVIALPIGVTIKAVKEGHEPVICTVAFRGSVKNKFLTYRDKGELKSFAIKDYPGMTYQNHSLLQKKGGKRMDKNQFERKRILRMASGAIEEKVDYEVYKVIDNIAVSTSMMITSDGNGEMVVAEMVPHITPGRKEETE